MANGRNGELTEKCSATGGPQCADVLVLRSEQRDDRRRIANLEHVVFGNEKEGLKTVVERIWTIMEGQRQGRAVQISVVMATVSAVVSIAAAMLMAWATLRAGT